MTMDCMHPPPAVSFGTTWMLVWGWGTLMNPLSTLAWAQMPAARAATLVARKTWAGSPVTARALARVAPGPRLAVAVAVPVPVGETVVVAVVVARADGVLVLVETMLLLALTVMLHVHARPTRVASTLLGAAIPVSSSAWSSGKYIAMGHGLLVVVVVVVVQ